MSKLTANFIVRDGKLVPATPDSFAEFIREYEGKFFIVKLELLGEKSSARMRAYYFGPFLAFFLPLLRETGVSASEGGADLYFTSRFAVKRYEQLPNQAGEIIMFPIMEKREEWSAKRWHDFISDCCREVIETFSATEIPDAQDYLKNKKR